MCSPTVWLLSASLLAADPALDGLVAQLARAQVSLDQARAALDCWTDVQRQWQQVRTNLAAHGREYLASRRAAVGACALTGRERELLEPTVLETDPEAAQALARIGTIELTFVTNDPGPTPTVFASYRGALAQRLAAMGLKVVEPAAGAHRWRIQQALIAVNQGPVMGTRMLSLRTGGNIQLIDPEGGVVASAELGAAQGHLNEEVGLSKAAAKLGDDAAGYVLGVLIDRLAKGARP